MAKKSAPQPPNNSDSPEIQIFKDDGEPGAGESIGLVILNAPIIEHKDGQLVPAIRLTTEQGRQLITKIFALIVEIDSDPPE